MGLVLLLLLMCTTMVNAQVSSWRNNPPSPISSGPTILGQRSDISMWRDNPPRDTRPPRTKSGSNIIVTDPWIGGWRWNRWDLWGAPGFGWNYWSPMWYWNDWGYRQPARIYVYSDGRKDTIRGKKPIMTFSIHKTTNNQIGGSFSIGGKGYFIADFVSTYQPDRSTFFPFGRITQVDFPLISDLIKEKTIYLGGGMRYKRTGFHTLIGFGSERILWRGKDAIGEITFPKSKSTFLTAKVGVMHDIQRFTLKVDTDPVRDYFQFGLGFNF